MLPRDGKQNKEMWLYIIILLAVIFGLWLHFFKLEIKKNSQAGVQSDNGFAQILNQFNDSFKQGQNIISEIKKVLPTASSTLQNGAAASTSIPALTEQQKQELLKKIKAKNSAASSTPTKLPINK